MDSKRGVSGRMIAGLIVIAIGAVFLLNTLDVIDIGEIISWIVAIAFIAAGLGTLITKKFRQVFFPVVLIVIGVFLILGNLEVDAYQYWPVVLIAVGVAIIFRGLFRRSRKREKKSNVIESSMASSSASESSSEGARTTTDGVINISCTLGETNERVETSNFSGGAVSVTLGNVKLDLRDAVIVNSPATLNVSLTMAGLHLRVPPDWSVAFENDVTMAEAKDKRSESGSTSDVPHLMITGSLTMASLEILD